MCIEREWIGIDGDTDGTSGGEADERVRVVVDE